RPSTEHSGLPLSSTPTTPPNTYTLSLHDALPIWNSTRRRKLFVRLRSVCRSSDRRGICSFSRRPERIHSQMRSCAWTVSSASLEDRKSTRLNSSHGSISYAVFCLNKKTTVERSQE